MTLAGAVLAFAVVAGLLTLTPGLDTTLVLRAALTRSRREAAATAAGILGGLFVWGGAAAAGVSALLTASQLAYDVLRLAGAAYLLWVGGRLVLRALRPRTGAPATPEPSRAGTVWRAARLGLVTNLLNPKVGIFYLALLPQFVPPGSDPLLVGLLLTAVHVALSSLWFGLLVVLASAAARWLRRPAAVRSVDGAAGATMAGFGLHLALTGR